MTKRTTKPEPTAAETYAARRNDIARLMDVLQMELDRHAEGAKADPRNWGFAGSLGKVRSDLIDLVGFMSNMDPEHVVAFLNDAE
ncbi:MAG: hypothetical protein KF787_03175 [Phycisphaeraceae bacterium]|nr:hypothetical protein [Phycisphaerae bacterium]MBX3391630.1 hypothetical protein [Phycisphaeraceae bacterium]